MDIIYLRDLRIDTIIGVYRWEREMKQTLVIDLELGTDIRPAAKSDAIADTLNYKDITERVTAFVEQSRYQLVEALAEAVAKLVLDEFPVPWLRLSVNKQGAVRGVRDVGVCIVRHRLEDGDAEGLPRDR
ncbi:MAG: dihydroneopterin aldolase [Gammaproteobacteria bacterium]